MKIFKIYNTTFMKYQAKRTSAIEIRTDEQHPASKHYTTIWYPYHSTASLKGSN